ncbi:MAG: PKD domain-containing protein, partial [Thermoplasmatota archaeon]
YQARDVAGLLSGPALVTITVVPNNPPLADFTTALATFQPGQSGTFLDASSDPDLGDSVTCWFWDFGDGTNALVTDPAHVFAAPGDYEVRLTVCDSWGYTDSLTRTLHVGYPATVASDGVMGGGGGAMPPVADAGVDFGAVQGETTSLHGSAQPAAASFEWRQVGGPPVALRNGTTATPSFVAPQLVGDEPIHLAFSLRVTDGALMSGWDTVVVEVRSGNHAPVAIAKTAGTAAVGATVTLDGSRSSDPDGDTLTYLWTQIKGPAVTLAPPTAAQTTFTVPAGASASKLMFLLHVSDGRTGSDDATMVYIDALAPEPSPAAPAPVDKAREVPAVAEKSTAQSPVVGIGLLMAALAAAGLLWVVAVRRRRKDE